MRGKVIRALKPLHAIAVENPALPGTPDVNYVEGWLELKWIRAWPKRASSVVQIDHYSPQQRIWHIKRRVAGGSAWFLLQCGGEWLLLDGAVAALHVNAVTHAELIGLCHLYCSGGLKVKELIECISKRMNVFTLSDANVMKLRERLREDTASQPDATSIGNSELWK